MKDSDIQIGETVYLYSYAIDCVLELKKKDSFVYIEDNKNDLNLHDTILEHVKKDYDLALIDMYKSKLNSSESDLRIQEDKIKLIKNEIENLNSEFKLLKEKYPEEFI